MALVDVYAGPQQRIADVGDYFALLKPRVMSLVIFTGLAGIVAAPGHIHVLTAFTALLCIAVAAGASGALNMAYDSDIDAIMARTATRPIPMGYVSREEALTFGWWLSVASVTIMGLFINLLAAGLLAFTIFFYVVVYTLWLKRSTAQNIVIGGLAGALPPAIGWAAVTGSLSLAPVGFGTFGVLYGIAAAVLGAAFLWLAIELRRTMARAAAVRLFHFSLLYLALLFVAMAIDTVVI